MVERGEDEEFDFSSTLNLFSETRKVEVANRFRKEADAYYVEAKRSMVSSIAQVPVWIYGVMVALGWNEFMAVVRSPLYFTFLVLCLAGAYVVWKLNMSGPILSVSKAVGREVHRLADEQLRKPLQPASSATCDAEGNGRRALDEAGCQEGGTPCRGVRAQREEA
ncbi:hypothetical protein L7F22_046373 [Adiantum nelumboides]|nr:hypothetical protein [Adiantum nelumboides]